MLFLHRLMSQYPDHRSHTVNTEGGLMSAGVQVLDLMHHMNNTKHLKHTGWPLKSELMQPLGMCSEFLKKLAKTTFV